MFGFAHEFAWVFGGVSVFTLVVCAVLAYLGLPVLTLLTKFIEAILLPMAGVVGQGLAMLVKFEGQGGIDMLATGQRILFVATVGAFSWWGAEHYLMKQLHAHYWFAQKHYQVVVPHKHR
jgi:hypothetical protein